MAARARLRAAEGIPRDGRRHGSESPLGERKQYERRCAGTDAEQEISPPDEESCQPNADGDDAVVEGRGGKVSERQDDHP